jgi:DNA-binding transcriptional LysR family regulator
MLNEIDLSRIDLNLLILFEVVLKERHVGRAAVRLNLSPSAVSHGLRRLRRLLDDPLFLRTPKGVVPSARAAELAEPIADILARVKHVIASAEPFAPATSTRRFTIGAPDGLSATFLPPLLGSLRISAPDIDLGVRELLPDSSIRSAERFWTPALNDLEARTMDIAVLPLENVPARFVARPLYEDDFVIAMRAGHPFAAKPTLARFCEMQHLMVSLTADAFGFVDEALKRQGLARRIALTVPNFMLALTMIAETDLIAALPRRLTSHHAQRFGVTSTEAPLVLPRFHISAVAPSVALMDAGVAWLLDTLQNAMTVEATTRQRPRSRKRQRSTSR